MMEPLLPISNINDFLFCPVSIYYHNLKQDPDRMLSNSVWQIEGTNAHKALDQGTYSTRSDVLSGIDVCSMQYRLVGKIDLLDKRTGTLIERKKHVTRVYDGFVYQLYAQCVCLREMGYTISHLQIHSMDDNRNYHLSLPEEDPDKFRMFVELLDVIKRYDVRDFRGCVTEKCTKCIYSSICSFSDTDDVQYRFLQETFCDGLYQ